MLPGDRLVCAFVELKAAGARFEQWPLHVTIVPWFRLGESSDVIAEGLTRAVTEVEPFEVHMGDEAFFGPHKNRPVRLIEVPTPFERIEAKVRMYLHKKRALLIDETTKRRTEFRPHVTRQGTEGLQEGATFRCEDIYIIEQHGSYKAIVRKIPLGGHE